MPLAKRLRRLIGQSLSTRGDGPDARFRAMVEASADVICRIVDHRLTYVSPSAAVMFGWDTQAIIGTNPLANVHEADRPILEKVIADLLAEGRDQVSPQARVVCGDGTVKWTEASVRVEPGGNRTHHEVLLIIRDISDRKRLEMELASLALQDGLTGLANRRGFDQTLEMEWRRTLRQGGQMALLLLDVDHFKTFNDTYGHGAGDDCLRAIAACLKTHARRPGDSACRYGGEELAMILGDTGLESAERLAEEIRDAVAALQLPHIAGLGANQSHVTISIGVATALARVGGSMRMPESLLLAADHALYKAKAAGRNCVQHSVLIAPADAK